MRMRSRVLPLLGLLSLAALPAGAQDAQSAAPKRADVAKIRDERFRWFVGAQGGALFFGTQSQTTAGIPTGGLHLGVIARQAGLMLSVDEGFGSDEPTAFEAFGFDEDGAALVLASPVTFDRIRRYTFTLTGYPVRGTTEPYLGVGFGLLQVVSPVASGVYASELEATNADFIAHEAAASGFVHFTAGLQVRFSGVSAFGQYQIATAPGQTICASSDNECRNSGIMTNNLLRGTIHSLMGGIRISMGKARQEITGGGY